MVNEVNVNGTIEDLSVKSLNHVGGVQVGTPEDGNILKYDAQLGVWTKGEAPRGVVDYSLEEVDTGIKWIDGKKIYKKVFYFENLNGFKGEKPVQNMNVDKCVNIYGMASQIYGWQMAINSYETVNELRYVAFKPETNNFYFSGFEKITSAYVVLEYTKTTD